MNKNHLLISSLITVVLLTMVFTPLSGQQDSSFDPWIDYNDDGIVDVNDLSTLGQAYGSSGDPTKNVNVTNWPLDAFGNLIVGIAKPVDKSGNVKVYIANFPHDAYGNLKVNVTNWAPKCKTPLVIDTVAGFNPMSQTFSVNSSWIPVDGYTRGYLFLSVVPTFSPTLQYVNMTWWYRVETLQVHSGQTIQLDEDVVYSNTTVPISPIIGNEMQFRFTFKRSGLGETEIYYIVAFLYLSDQ